MESTNADKRVVGIENRRALENLFVLCQELDYIQVYVKDYKIGKTGYDPKQFKAPYMIRFANHEEWIIYTTTSLRERIKSADWDALNIKSARKEVRRAYLVYPDNTKDKEKVRFRNKDKKIQEHKEYSSLDAVLPQDSLFNVIEKYALGLMKLSKDKRKDLEGKNFESRIAFTLSLDCNLNKWKNGGTREGLFYSYYEKILSVFGLDPLRVANIYAISGEKEIGLLSSGGKPKTDVLATVTYDDGRTEDFTISCKRSGRNEVSIAQETGDSIANALDASNSELRRLLNEYQKTGSRERMDHDYPGDAELLEKEIDPYIFSLCEFVVSGKGKPVKKKSQIAEYLLVYDNRIEDIDVHKAYEYCQKLDKKRTRAFHTPLSWTYPSKQRGKYIQFKAPIKL